MKKMPNKAIVLTSLLMTAIILAGCIGTSHLTTGSDQGSQPWSFGVISDTQWTVNDDGYNPNTVAANIIR